MSYDWEAHRLRMVDHFISLEQFDPDYAIWALDQYRRTPSSPFPGILADVKAEKARRAVASMPDSSETP
jgi:hypothetical protein